MRPTVRWEIDPGFELDEFLARPLVARVATAGPAVRPVWYVWEEGCFWWLTGGWSTLAAVLGRDPSVALVVDTCELETGRVLQVVARGEAEVVGFDAERAQRKLARYLGADRERWPERFAAGTFDDPTARFVRLAPRTLRARDLSFAVSAPRAPRPPS